MDAWCHRHDLARGAIVGLEQVWSLAKHWYTGRADASWRGRTPDQAEAAFRAAGLEGPFWTF